MVRQFTPVPRTAIGVLLMVAAAGGCSDSQEWLAETGQLVGARPEAIDVTTMARAVAPAAQARPFQPLNPKRENPFAYGGDAMIGSDTAASRFSQTVVLGFVATDEARVILSLAGHPHTLATGQSAGGISVEEISPPTVTLRSGVVTWTASMFDE